MTDDQTLDLDVSPLLREVEQVTGERDRARDLAAALEAKLARGDTRWLTRIALGAVNAQSPGSDAQYEAALLDALEWWLEARQALPAVQPTVTQLRRWARLVTEAHDDTLDEPTLLALWERARLVWDDGGTS